MGYDWYEQPAYPAVKTRLQDMVRQHENAHEIKKEFARHHGFSAAGTDGIHTNISYYWGRGELTPTNDSNDTSLGQTFLDCSDDYIFKNDAVWLVQVGLSWTDDVFQRGIEGRMYVKGNPPSAGSVYHAYQPEPTSLYGQGMGLGVASAAQCIVASSESGLPADFALLLELSGTSVSYPGRGDGSAMNWRIRGRISNYWGAAFAPGPVHWTAAIVRLG